MRTSKDAKSLLLALDEVLVQVCQMTGRLCREAHLADEDIDQILSTKNRDHLEIISDTADEVLSKTEALIVEARLTIRNHLETGRKNG